MKKTTILLCLIMGVSFSANDFSVCAKEGYVYGEIPYLEMMDALDFECWANLVSSDIFAGSCEKASVDKSFSKVCKISTQKDKLSKYKVKTFKEGVAGLYRRMVWNCVKEAKIYKNIDEDEGEERFKDCMTDASINPSYSIQIESQKLMLNLIK